MWVRTYKSFFHKLKRQMPYFLVPRREMTILNDCFGIHPVFMGPWVFKMSTDFSIDSIPREIAWKPMKFNQIFLEKKERKSFSGFSEARKEQHLLNLIGFYWEKKISLKNWIKFQSYFIKRIKLNFLFYHELENYDNFITTKWSIGITFKILDLHKRKIISHVSLLFIPHWW